MHRQSEDVDRKMYRQGIHLGPSFFYILKTKVSRLFLFVILSASIFASIYSSRLNATGDHKYECRSLCEASFIFVRF